uniref:Uncharacterized protein n=1 Tax=Trichobilharzia regenti TaxID=157069 RepID=A0AA85IRA4_TRIRE|nr:unnamed protein product [Trichobilharzia regenti]
MRPRVLSVGVSSDAFLAIDYGWKGLVALSSFTNILIIDPYSCKSIQSLQGHCANVINVQWAPENYYHDDKSPFQLRLASVDSSGVIIVWDAFTATATSEFREADSSVLDMMWLPNQWVSRDLLGVLHSHAIFIIWNTQTQTQLWKYTFDDSIASFSLDLFSASKIVFYSREHFVVENFSVTLCSFGKARRQSIHGTAFHTETDCQGTGTGVTSVKSAISGWISSMGISERTWDTSSDKGGTTPKKICLQVTYHGYNKDCVLFVFKREIVFVNLAVIHPLGVISLDRSRPSFSRVYSCTQRDVIICLHENGNLSVYARRGLALAMDFYAHSSNMIQKTCKETYELDNSSCSYVLVATAASSRRPKQAYPVNFTVDRLNEVTIAVASVDGRMQFWQLRSIRKSFVENEEQKPVWSLSDLIPHESMENKRPIKLYLELNSLYTPNRSEPTLCRVCPPNLIKTGTIDSICGPLVAVGNTNGDVQIWDISSTLLWREYHVLPVAIKGIEWITIPLTIYRDCHKNDNSLTSRTNEYSLGLIVYGWQPKDGHQSSLTENTSNKTNAMGKNFVITVDLLTGYMRVFRDASCEKMNKSGSGMGTGGSLGQLLSGLNDQDRSLEGPVDIIRVSYTRQYVGIIVRKGPVEIWNLCNSSLLTKLSLLPDVTAVALDWCHSPYKERGRRDSQKSLKSGDYMHTKELSRNRESCIMCTSDGSIRLIAVNKDSVDSTSVSNTILSGLPAVSLNRINTVAWFSDLVAFGTSDGFVAVRDLHGKRTLFRTTIPTSQSNYLDQAIGTLNEQYFDPDIMLDTSLCSVLPSIRHLCFTPGFSSLTHLLSLQFDSVCVWEPRQMLLLCMIEFTGSVHHSLVSADWVSIVSKPSDKALCILLSRDGALRLVQAGQANYEMTVVGHHNHLANSGGSITRGTTLHDPISKFYIKSALPDRPEIQDPVLIPSLLPPITALNIRHLLQNQPWCDKVRTVPTVMDSDPLIDITSDCEPKSSNAESPNFDLLNQKQASYHSSEITDVPAINLHAPRCSVLAPGFAKIQNAVNIFLYGMKTRRKLVTSFMNPSSTTIIERCLWTAQLFSDVYEVKFWRLVANRLLYKKSVNSFTNSPSDKELWSRYFLDLSWDFLADCRLYRQNVENYTSLMEKSHYSSIETMVCVDTLLMIGQPDRAVNLLLETPVDSNLYSLNMHRACLLAANATRKSCLSGPSIDQSVEDTYLSTVKLVATNLLSNGRINEGIGLLCLIGLQIDACRYLESFDQWDRAIWLAKCTLSNGEHDKVLRRWASYLSSSQVHRKDLAVLVYLYLEDHNAVLKSLSSLNQYQLAARYLEACYELGVLKPTKETDSLYSSIFMEFGSILTKLGHHEAATYYCNLAGKVGDALREEIDFLSS